MHTKKYFIAIILDGPGFDKIEALKQDLYTRHGLRGALRSPAHITLHRPFEWKEEKEPVLIEQLNLFRFGPSFELELEGFDGFEPRVIYAALVHQPALYDLHARLTSFARRELKLFNESEDERGFHPHVTVAFRDLKKPLYHQLMPEFRQTVLREKMWCKGFSLLKLEKTWSEHRFFAFDHA